jgi:hypothetical protein
MSRKQKIIMLGCGGYQRNTDDIIVDCFSWDDIAKIKNIRDYDTLVVNLLSLSSVNLPLNGDIVFEHLNIASTLEIIRNNGEIIVIGDPRFEVEITDQENKDKKIKKPFLRWTGIDFFWDNSPGDTKIFKDDYSHRSFQNYISYLKGWKYSLRGINLDTDRVMFFHNKEIFLSHNYKLDIKRDDFCYNRYKNAIAFSLQIGIFSKNQDNELLLYGPIHFLPKISKNEDEIIQIVLRDLCAIEAELPEPEWLKDYSAPGQEKIDKKIEQVSLNINNGLQDLKRVREEKEKIRTCLKLLYEREYALEPATRDILRALGAHVEDPSEPGKEDGWIVVSAGEKNYEGVLEIKSTKSDQFSEGGRKQLLDWIDRGIRLREKKYKGIFIGNSAVDKPLKERSWAFSDSWQKSSKLSEICAIKTEDLYTIYLLKQSGKLDANKFWKVFFETNGIFDIKQFLPTQEEEQKIN